MNDSVTRQRGRKSPQGRQVLWHEYNQSLLIREHMTNVHPEASITSYASLHSPII